MIIQSAKNTINEGGYEACLVKASSLGPDLCQDIKGMTSKGTGTCALDWWDCDIILGVKEEESVSPSSFFPNNGDNM